VKVEIASETQAQLLENVIGRMQIWIIVTSNDDKKAVQDALGDSAYSIEVFSLDNVRSELEKLNTIGA